MLVSPSPGVLMLQPRLCSGLSHAMGAMSWGPTDQQLLGHLLPFAGEQHGGIPTGKLKGVLAATGCPTGGLCGPFMVLSPLFLGSSDVVSSLLGRCPVPFVGRLSSPLVD